MAYTAQKLITQSWYLSGIVSRGVQTVSGNQINDGLDLLNALLNFKQIETDLLPYNTYDQSVSTVAGQEVYFIESCAQLQSVTFNYYDVRYAVPGISNQSYFAGYRVNNLTTLPIIGWTTVRQDDGLNLYLYPIPDQAYELNLFGKFYLTNVNLTTDLSLELDTSYIEYLRYALAEYMCSYYNIEFPPQSARILQQYKRKLMDMSPPDLTNLKTSVLVSGISPVSIYTTGLFTGSIP